MSNTMISSFLSLNGQAQEAIAFYEKNLYAEVLFKITNTEIKQKMDQAYTYREEEKEWIAHSVLKIGASQVMIADELMTDDPEYRQGTNFSLCLLSDSIEEITEYYENVVSDSRTRVIVPLAPNLFAKAYGIVEDPFGVVIQIGSEK